MNTGFTKSLGWLVVAEAAVVVLMLLSWLWMGEAKAACHDSRENLKLCHQLADEIETLQTMSSVRSCGANASLA